MRPPDDEHLHHEQDLSDRLDDLALADASAAGPLLEERVIAGVASVFAPASIAIGRARRPWHARTAFRAPFALAAGVALAVSVGILIRPSGPPPGVSGSGTPAITNVALVEQRIDGLLAVTGDAGERSFEDRVASIALWADVLAADTEHGWLGSDLADPAWYEDGWSDLTGAEGAM